MNCRAAVVLAKAFYRGLGKLVGLVAMVALFPQQPVLPLTTMALCSGCMATGMRAKMRVVPKAG